MIDLEQIARQIREDIKKMDNNNKKQTNAGMRQQESEKQNEEHNA